MLGRGRESNATKGVRNRAEISTMMMDESKNSHTPLLGQDSITGYSAMASSGLSGKEEAEKQKQEWENSRPKDCNDSTRCFCCGHGWHWSEWINILVFAGMTANQVLNPLKSLGLEIHWYLLIGVSVLGLFFLWDIGSIHTAAEYSRKIHDACGDILEESQVMDEELSKFKEDLAIEKGLAKDAAMQTANFAKECGLLNDEGQVMHDELAHFNDAFFSNSDIRSCSMREKRSSMIIGIVDKEVERNNAFDRIIKDFKELNHSLMGDEASQYNLALTDKRAMKRFNSMIKAYNKSAENPENALFPVDPNISAYAGEMSEKTCIGRATLNILDFAEAAYEMVFDTHPYDIMDKMLHVESGVIELQHRLDEVNSAIDKAKRGELTAHEFEIVDSQSIALDDDDDDAPAGTPIPLKRRGSSASLLKTHSGVMFSTSASSFDQGSFMREERNSSVLKMGSRR